MSRDEEIMGQLGDLLYKVASILGTARHLVNQVEDEEEDTLKIVRAIQGMAGSANATRSKIHHWFDYDGEEE